MKIKAEIQALFDGYKKAWELYKAAREELEKDERFKEDYKFVVRNQLNADFEEKARAADADLLPVFDNTIQTIMAKRNYRPDFKENLSTALTYITAMGDNIIDDLAHDLIYPLLGDYPTMARLYAVLGDKIYPDENNTTLVELSGFLDAVNTLKEMKSKYSGIFTNIFEGAKFQFPGAQSLLLNNLNTSFHYSLLNAEGLFMRDVDEYEKQIEQLENSYAHNREYIA